MLQPSEQSLQDMIVERNSLLALKYLDFFYENASIRLSVVGEDGKSFLHHALEVGLKEVAERLLEKEINHSFLFERDNSGQTCLFLAARQGYPDIVRILMEKNKEAKSYETGNKIWLQPDLKGNVPLHAAVEKGHIATVRLLIEEIIMEPDAVNHINRINNSGDTPLHLAFARKYFSTDIRLPALLILHGADLTLTNTKQQTPFLLLCQLDFTETLTLFSLLKQDYEKRDMRLFFLQMYRNYVIACPDNAIVLKQYYLLTCSHSLKMYASAKLEFDSRIDIRNFYFSVKKNRSTGEIEQVDREIPRPILKTIPLYKNKVDIARQALLANDMSDTNEESSDLESTVKQERYQLLHQDKDTLLKLIKETEAFILHVQARPESESKSIILICTILLLVYLGIEIPLAINALHFNARLETSEEQYLKNNLPPILFGIFGLFLLISVFAYVWTCMPHRPVYMSQNEWKELIDQFESILEKLQILEQKELKDKLLDSENKITGLPVPVDTIRKLESTLVEFDNERKTVADMKNLLGRTDVILKDIQNGMHLTNNPFSMFYTSPQCIVNIPKTGSGKTLVEPSDEDSSSGFEMGQSPNSSIFIS